MRCQLPSVCADAMWEQKATASFARTYGAEPSSGTKEYAIYRWNLLRHLAKISTAKAHPDFNRKEIEIYIEPLMKVYWGADKVPSDLELQRAYSRGQFFVDAYREQNQKSSP
jgi:hypothetical protein